MLNEIVSDDVIRHDWCKWYEGNKCDVTFRKVDIEIYQNEMFSDMVIVEYRIGYRVNEISIWRMVWHDSNIQ